MFCEQLFTSVVNWLPRAGPTLPLSQHVSMPKPQTQPVFSLSSTPKQNHTPRRERTRQDITANTQVLHARTAGDPGAASTSTPTHEVEYTVSDKDEAFSGSLSPGILEEFKGEVSCGESANANQGLTVGGNGGVSRILAQNRRAYGTFVKAKCAPHFFLRAIDSRPRRYQQCTIGRCQSATDGTSPVGQGSAVVLCVLVLSTITPSSFGDDKWRMRSGDRATSRGTLPLASLWR